MIEGKAVIDSISVSAVALEQPVTAGALLRRARESAGLHIAALAVSLKVPVVKLEALESNRIDLLPDAVFARALASAVCRVLKIDPKDILDKLPSNSAPKLTGDEHGINTPFRTSGAGPTRAPWQALNRAGVWIPVALLAGAALLIFMPGLDRFGFGDPKSSTGADGSLARDMTPAVLAAPLMVTSPEVSRLQQGANDTNVADVALTAAPAGLNAAPVAAPLSELTAAAKAVASAAGSVPSVALGQSDVTVGLAATDSTKPTNLSSASVLVIKAKGATWVSISDARGVTQVSKMLALDEVVSSGGPLPLSVVVGRSDRAEATVRGNAFDMKATAKENVARFQVR